METGARTNMSDIEKDKEISEETVADAKATPKKDSDVLDKVLSSIEMAGASLDFFDESEEKVSTEEEMSAQETANIEDIEAMEGEQETLLDEDGPEVDFIEHKQALSILESLLFSSERPLGLGTFKQVFKGTNYKSKEIKKALEELQSEYADVSRGVSLEEINGGWQLRTKVDNMDYLRRLAKARPFKLSGPALEVLAIIAYKQPLIKSEVDDIRGVESGHLVRALMEKGLICFQGKSELPGKPMQYGTTRKFLEIFGLRNLRELPSLDEIDQLLPDGIGIEEEDEKLSDVTETMAEEFAGSYSEGEEELEKIEATLGDIDTSSEFFEEEKRRQREKRDRDRAQDIREALDVGEEVDPKDEKWLARYDEKIALEQAEADALRQAEEQKAKDNDIEADLSDLTAETLVSAEVLQMDDAFEAEDESLLKESINPLDEALESEDEDEIEDEV
jgi:segregation and condensation protein B